MGLTGNQLTPADRISTERRTVSQSETEELSRPGPRSCAACQNPDDDVFGRSDADY